MVPAEAPIIGSLESWRARSHDPGWVEASVIVGFLHELSQVMNDPSVSTTLPSRDAKPGRAAPLPVTIPEEKILSCVHCGLCTATCPTYTLLGDENDSPRGRIYLMHAVVQGRLPITESVQTHLDRCLDCRACETACPSGVEYSRILEPFRLATAQAQPSWKRRADWFRQVVLLRIFPYPERIRRALTPIRLLQKAGLYEPMERMGLWDLLPARLRAMLTLVNASVPAGPPLPDFLPAKGRRRARVAFFVGCVADAMFRHVHWATVRVLQENGCDVVIPGGQCCCGAIHYHVADEEGAKRFADQNVRAFPVHDVDAVIVNHAGCGAMLKDYGHYWKDSQTPKRQEFAAKVRDINEFLDQLGLVPPIHPANLTVAYHDACHLAHAQGIVAQPRRLLSQIPGLRLVPLPESNMCCGSAGSYNLLHHDLATRLGRRKLENILRTGAEVVLASNAGCLLQIEREIRRARAPVAVLHPMELLDACYRGEKPRGTTNGRMARPSRAGRNTSGNVAG